MAKSSAIKGRVNFASITNSSEYPDFLNIQLKSFQEFFQVDTKPEDRMEEGLYGVFSDNFPITDARGQFVLEFLDYFVDPARYSEKECIERGLTYSVPLKARLKLYCTDPEHEDFETIVQDVYLGTIPYMSARGTFIVNGAERVVVSQLHRSPGVFFGQSYHANGTKLYSARIIPFKGSWIEFATDINQVMYAYIDRKKKLPVTTLFRAIGYERDKDILEIFDLAEEVKVSKAALKRIMGRKLAARVLKTWIEDFVDEDTGEVVSIERNEVILDRDTILEKDHMEDILEAEVPTVLLHREDIQSSEYSIIYNTLQKDPTNSEKEAVESGFNFGPQLTSNKTVSDLVSEVILHYPGEWLDESDPNALHEASKLNLAIDKAFHILEWKPVWGFEKTIEKTVNWYRQSGSGDTLSYTRQQITSYMDDALSADITWSKKD